MSSTFLSIKKTEGFFSADSFILACKVIFGEYELPKKIMQDAGSIFFRKKSRTAMQLVIVFQKKNLWIYRNLNLKQAVSSSCDHQSNGQMAVYIK